MSAAELLLSRLDRVRPGAIPGQWMAKCPGHQDRLPSLSVREESDGRLLLHCFGGCDAADVVAAIGLTLADLFPAPIEPLEPQKARWNHAELLRVLSHETGIVLIAAEDMRAGRPISDSDMQRLARAVAKIQRVAEIAA